MNDANTTIERVGQGCTLLLIGVAGTVISVLLLLVFGQPWSFVMAALVLGGIVVALGTRQLRIANRRLAAHPLIMTTHSPRLREYITFVQSRTGRRVIIIDSGVPPTADVGRGAPVPTNLKMPGHFSPPFGCDPDFSMMIKVHVTSGMLSDEEMESTVANILTIVLLYFEGFPQVKMARTGWQSGLPPRDAEGIQHWLHMGLLGIVAQVRVKERGFSRRESLDQRAVDGLYEPRFPLSCEEASIVLHAINLALAQLKEGAGIYAVELSSKVEYAVAAVEAERPRVSQISKDILDVLRGYNWMTPRGFGDGFRAVLGLWDLEDAIEFGYVDPRTGITQPP